jgi:transcriptional regulator with XRE-family HTH domain
MIALPRKPIFARYLRDARIKRGLSVVEVAEQVGVSGPCVYFWEMGRTRPRDVNLTALCKTLKLPIRATREMAAAG